MSIRAFFRRLGLGWCSHGHTYRERRKLHGVLVLHLVCDRCGHARPAVDRTAAEHRRVVKTAKVAPIVTRQPASVVKIGRGR